MVEIAKRQSASLTRLLLDSHTQNRRKCDEAGVPVVFSSVKEDAGSRVHFCGATQTLLLSRVRGEEGWHSGVLGWLHIYTNLTRRAYRANRMEPRRVSAQVPIERRGRESGSEWVYLVSSVGAFGQGNAGSRPWAAAHVLSWSSLSLYFVRSLVDALIMRGVVDGLRMLCVAGVVSSVSECVLLALYRNSYPPSTTWRKGAAPFVAHFQGYVCYPPTPLHSSTPVPHPHPPSQRSHASSFSS